jgi:endonuclease/exonuclease/phosphatase family metal-dependent hydrolase
MPTTTRLLLPAIIAMAIAWTFAGSARATDTPATATGELRVMSFNIRNSGAKDGVNAWPKRANLFFQVIESYDPDLLGVQEVLADQHDQIQERLKGYALAGVARDDGKREGEWALVAFRTSRFEKVAEGNFWLSETPDVPSKSWDAACVRICSWVRLKDKAHGGRELIYANTHWDHVGKVARRKAAEIIKTKLPELSAGAPAILTGDFNSTEDDDWVKSLLHPEKAGQVQLTDSYREVHPERTKDERTFHGFKGGLAGSRIDFVLHSDAFKAVAATIDRTKSAEGRYPSDHYAVTATLEWK